MKFNQDIGIIAYGTCLPETAIKLSEIEKSQGKEINSVSKALGVEQKSVPDTDEDTITLATEAARQALERLNKKSNINALYIGSESHPYAVKPSSTVVKQALGLDDELSTADLQFACKAGTQALQIGAAYLGSGMSQEVMAIGADTAQAAPGDALEFTASAGAAAFILGKKNILAKLLATVSITTDTPDFWRRQGESYPQHAGRFTGEPAYFHHVLGASKKLMNELDIKASEIDYCVFHTPNAKFPTLAAKRLGFSYDQLLPSLIVKKVGNTYAGASMLALAVVLDKVEAGKKILVTSYGSGAGSDSFLFETTKELVEKRKNWKNSVEEQIEKFRYVDYQEYRSIKH